MIHKTVKMLHGKRTEGDLLMDTPVTTSWEELKKLTFEDDKKEWWRRVRTIKDTVHIQVTKGKGQKKKSQRPAKRKKRGVKVKNLCCR